MTPADDGDHTSHMHQALALARDAASRGDYSGSEAEAHPFRGVDKAKMICHKPHDIGWL